MPCNLSRSHGRLSLDTLHTGRHEPRLLACAAAAAFALFLALPVAAHERPDYSRCDELVRAQLANQSKTGWARVIVSTSEPLTAEQERQLRALGVDITRRYSVIKGFACLVPSRSLPALTRIPFVAHVSADATVRKTDEFTVKASGADIAFSQYKLDGKSIGVAVIDSGINTGFTLPADLKAGSSGTRVTVAKSFVTGDTSPADPTGHGTHVAGIIAGNGNSSAGSAYYRTFYGIARNANIVSLRVLNAQGSGNVSDVVAAIQWAVANKAAYNIRVMNISLGHAPGDSYVNDPLCQACETAWKAGIVVVVAAGNNGRASGTPTEGLSNEGYGTNYGSINSPGIDPYVITVGAMKQNASDPSRGAHQIATYSSRGPSRLDFILKPDIVAPGNQIISIKATTRCTLSPNYDATNMLPVGAYYVLPASSAKSQYFFLSGTSMAAPVVSGAAALLLQKYPTLSPDTVKARLMMSADKWGDPQGYCDPCTYGAGYLNIPAALSCTVVATQYAMSPALIDDAAGNVNVSLDPTFWGTRAIWGTGINNLSAIWGTRAIWGTTTLSSSMAIWGTAVWSDRAMWGTTSANVDLSANAIFGEQ